MRASRDGTCQAWSRQARRVAVFALAIVLLASQVGCVQRRFTVRSNPPGARVFVDDCIARHLKGELDVATAAMAKYWTTDLQCEVVDQCLQFHGGYGYMWEYPIARLYADSRVQKIYGGTNEIMKEIISRFL